MPASERVCFMARAPKPPHMALAVYQGVLEALPDAALIVDFEGKVLAVNRHAEQLLKWARPELVGQSMGSMVAEGDRDRHPLLRREARTEERSKLGEVRADVRVLPKGGDEIPVEITFCPMGGEAADYVLAVVHEIVERSETGPVELARLKEMSEFRARFVNIAAHELKTPLTPIRMQLKLIDNYLPNPPEKVARSLAILTRSVDRLQTLVDDILDAARIQAVRLKLRQEPVSLTATVAESIENFGAVAKEVDVALHADLEPDVFVIGDRSRLLQIMNNLLSNAIKFTPAGGRIKVFLTKDASWADLEVEDSGRGMTEAQLGGLYQPFAQVHEDLEATQKGTGLGLYIVKGIIEQHRGSIATTSPGPGKGTRVTIRLPLTSSRAPPEEAPQPRRQGQLRERLREMV